MIIADLESADVRIAGGCFVVTMPVKTDRGVVGMTLSLRVSEHPELDALIPMIDDALRSAAKKALGLANHAGLTPAAKS